MSDDLLAGYMEKYELAGAMKKSKRTLDRWDKAGIGPPRITVGKKIYYRREAILDWLNSCEVDRRKLRTVRTRKRSSRRKAA